ALQHRKRFVYGGANRRFVLCPDRRGLEPQEAQEAQKSAQASTSSRADETASGFSRGRKWPASLITRRAINFENCTRSFGFSAAGRAIPSSAPYSVITGTLTLGR